MHDIKEINRKKSYVCILQSNMAANLNKFKNYKL